MTDTDLSEVSAGDPSSQAEEDVPSSAGSDEVRTPFAPESRQQLGGRGCAWMVGIGCGLLLLVALGLIAVMAVNGDRLLAWSLRQFEEQILVDAPEDFDQAQRDELEQAFATARERVAAGEVDPQSLQSFQSMMLELAFKPAAERSEEDYQRLIDALHRLAGEDPAEAPHEAEPESTPDHRAVVTETAQHHPVPTDGRLDPILV